MLLLTSTTDFLELTTGAALSTDFVASFVDITTSAFTPGSSQQNVATATTVTAVAAPAASTQRQIKMLSVTNRGATAQTVTVIKNAGAVAYDVTPAIVLQTGECLYYVDGRGFYVTDVFGQEKMVASFALASPTAKVGLVAVDGSAQTAMRSDAAPPIDQTIAPTWTGLHTFDGNAVVNANAGNALTTNAVAGSYGLVINGSSTTGQSLGLSVVAGTNNSDYGLQFVNNTSTLTLMRVYGDASWRLGHDGNAGNNPSLTGSATGNVTINAPSSGNALTLPTLTSGWGTPTGAAVVANFPGASATLVQCSEAIAEIILALKNLSLFAA